MIRMSMKNTVALLAAGAAMSGCVVTTTTWLEEVNSSLSIFDKLGFAANDMYFDYTVAINLTNGSQIYKVQYDALTDSNGQAFLTSDEHGWFNDNSSKPFCYDACVTRDLATGVCVQWANDCVDTQASSAIPLYNVASVGAAIGVYYYDLFLGSAYYIAEPDFATFTQSQQNTYGIISLSSSFYLPVDVVVTAPGPFIQAPKHEWALKTGKSVRNEMTLPASELNTEVKITSWKKDESDAKSRGGAFMQFSNVVAKKDFRLSTIDVQKVGLENLPESIKAEVLKAREGILAKKPTQ